MTITITSGWTDGLSQDYCGPLGRWFADRLGARQQLRETSMKVQNETSANYLVDSEDAVIAKAIGILLQRVRTSSAMASPQDVKTFCRLKLARLEHEVFGVMFLDVQNRLIEFREMFRGTLTQTSVYPREVVKEAMELDAAAVILTHNHPSGDVNPSRADQALTQTLKSALALIDVRVLDHIIVSNAGALSMAEMGLL